MNSIAKKLILYFTISLIIFSTIIGIIFIFIFKQNIQEKNINDLEKRSINIANSLSEFINSDFSSGKKNNGYGAYLKFIDDIAMSEVWIINKDLDYIYRGQDEKELSFSSLPKESEFIIKEALKGKTSHSQNFSGLFSEQTISVGTPILDQNKNPIAVVLLHKSFDDINLAVENGITILVISIFIAFIVSIFSSVILSFHFVKPIKKIEQHTNKLIHGEYTIKTNINQKDEIGKVAKSLDILSEKLYTASEETKKIDKLRKDFISNISHELRTPVTVIRGSLEALYDGIIEEKEQQKKYYKQMLNESIYLQRLVNDLLDLTKLQNTDFKIEVDSLNIKNLLEDCIHSISQISKNKNLSLNFKFDSDIFIFKGDYGRLRQMFLIILDNAVKFSNENNSIDIILNNEEKYISIKDYGKGINNDDLPYIFDRFYKTKSENNKSGTGLGLAIAKEIANKHNIKINVLSTENDFTNFKFLF